jgi:hypothetical protein
MEATSYVRNLPQINGPHQSQIWRGKCLVLLSLSQYQLLEPMEPLVGSPVRLETKNCLPSRQHKKLPKEYNVEPLNPFIERSSDLMKSIFLLQLIVTPIPVLFKAQAPSSKT